MAYESIFGVGIGIALGAIFVTLLWMIYKRATKEKENIKLLKQQIQTYQMQPPQQPTNINRNKEKEIETEKIEQEINNEAILAEIKIIKEPGYRYYVGKEGYIETTKIGKRNEVSQE